MDTNKIEIYVADLAAYNNGKLHGTWIDATLDVDDIQSQINTMLKNSPEPMSEEFAIHDYSGFEGVQVEEYSNIEYVHELACFIEEHGELGAKLLSYFGGELDDAVKMLEDQYAGCYESVADFARELTEDTTEIPANLSFYIDYEKMGRDLEINDLLTIEIAFDEVHIFWNH